MYAKILIEDLPCFRKLAELSAELIHLKFLVFICHCTNHDLNLNIYLYTGIMAGEMKAILVRAFSLYCY